VPVEALVACIFGMQNHPSISLLMARVKLRLQTSNCTLRFLIRSKRCVFRPLDLPDFDQLLEETDDQLFERILNNPHHTLYQLIPPQYAATQNYNLRRRTHDRQLHEHKGHE